MKRQERTYTTQSCKNSGANKIVPTHVMLFSRDSAAFIQSVSKSCRFHSQQHVQNNTQTRLRLPYRSRPTAQSRAPCRLLWLSRDKLCCSSSVFCWINFTFHSTELSSLVLSKLNRSYANQRSVSRLQTNKSKHTLCFKTLCVSLVVARSSNPESCITIHNQHRW